MFRSSLIIATTLMLLLSAGAQAAHVLWNDDYESGTHRGYFGSTLGGAIVTNPLINGTNSSAYVLQVSDTANTSPWGELRSSDVPSGSFALANYGAVPGFDTFTFKLNYFIPQDTVSVSGDGLTLIMRFAATSNGSPYSTLNSSSINVSTATRGEWRSLEVSGVIRNDHNLDVSGNQLPFFITPIIALSDAPTSGANGDNLPGILIYYDNVSFTVTPEPSKTLLLASGFALLFLRRNRL